MTGMCPPENARGRRHPLRQRRWRVAPLCNQVCVHCLSRHTSARHSSWLSVLAPSGLKRVRAPPQTESLTYCVASPYQGHRHYFIASSVGSRDREMIAVQVCSNYSDSLRFCSFVSNRPLLGTDLWRPALETCNTMSIVLSVVCH